MCSCPRSKQLIQTEQGQSCGFGFQPSLETHFQTLLLLLYLIPNLQQPNHIQLLPQVRQRLPSHKPLIPAAQCWSSWWKTKGIVPGWFSNTQLMIYNLIVKYLRYTHGRHLNLKAKPAIQKLSPRQSHSFSFSALHDLFLPHSRRAEDHCHSAYALIYTNTGTVFFPAVPAVGMFWALRPFIGENTWAQDGFFY